MTRSNSTALWSLSHANYNLEEREKFALSARQCKELEQAFHSQQAVIGVMVLSTCNRTEVLLSFAKDHNVSASESIGKKDWISQIVLEYLALSTQDLVNPIDFFIDGQAYEWMVRVACGLQSQILGEAEILGQLKKAYSNAKISTHLDTNLTKILDWVIRASKNIRTESRLGEHSVSFASVAAKKTVSIFDNSKQLEIILIGIGSNNLLLLRQLLAVSKKIVIVARSKLRAQESLNKFFTNPEILQRLVSRLTIVDFSNLAASLIHADVVIASTTSKEPIITVKMLQKRTLSTQFKPLLILDLSVPRNVEASVSAMDGVFMYNLDHISSIQSSNHHLRLQAAKKSNVMVSQWGESFRLQRTLDENVQLVTKLRQDIVEIQDRQTEELLLDLADSLEQDQKDILQNMVAKHNAKLVHEYTKIFTKSLSENTSSSIRQPISQPKDNSK